MPVPRFLMCRPTFFGVRYRINPWMDLRRQPDPALAMRQWRALKETLERDLGAQVSTCRAARGLPDMTFTANAGLVRGRTFIPSRFRHSERAGEAPRFTAWFRRRGYRILELPADLRFEGAGDALFVGDTLVAGYYHRTDVKAHALVGKMLGVRILSLELVDERFYHLDTCLAPLGPRSALYYPKAFDEYGMRVLNRNVPDLVPVTDDEARHFACNSIVVGRRAIIPKPCGRLCRVLTTRGFTVHALDLSEFEKAGGAARCLVLRLG